jgi:PTH1 family peptidyl-tRNA hydrolase
MPRFRRAGGVLVTDGQVTDQRVAIIKPQTYMNRSGTVLGPLMREPGFDPSSHMLVMVDDYAIPLGTMRFRARGSSGGHNGLQSIEDAVGSPDYNRLRIGVGPLPEGDVDPADFVLSQFTAVESRTLAELMPVLVEAVDCWVVEGIESAMNNYNQRVGDA